MKQLAKTFTLSACAMAASVLISACGGGEEAADTTPPTVTITDNVSGATATGAVTFTFTFSENVNDSFTFEDIQVIGGTAGAFAMASNGLSATLVVTPAADTSGTINVSVAAAKFKDLALNDNTATVTATQAYDTTVADVPPVGAGTVLLNFDDLLPTTAAGGEGGEGSGLVAAPEGGGSGMVYEVLRLNGNPWALSVLETPLPLTTTRKTISARVYSPTAGIPMVIKLEGANPGITTGEVQANEAVVQGWQTLTWTFASASPTATYTKMVLLPNLGTVDAAPGKSYYFDDFTLLEAPVLPTTGTVLLNFDDLLPITAAGGEGGEGSGLVAAPEGGGSGMVYEVLRLNGNPWALSVLETPLPLTTTRKTISARVYSPTAGIPMVIKLEGANPGITTGEVQANEAVVQGWQTLTWTFASGGTATYTKMVLLPNLGTVDATPGKSYYFDDFKLLDAADNSGGSGGSEPTTPGAEMGAGGPQTLTIASGDVKTGDGGNTMFVSGEGLFAVNYVGSAEPTPPNNLAGWPNAKTANFGGITGVAGGDIGYFVDDVNVTNSPQKVDEGGWVAGTALAPLGVPNFFRYYVLKGPVSNEAYMGTYVNAPNNGTVNVSTFSKIKIKVWGPAPMFEKSFNPVLQVTLVGPKVDGCSTDSGGSEITQNLTASLKNGAGGFYTMPLNGFAVKGMCGTDTAASVLSNLARVVVTVPGTSFNYTVIDGGNYTTGVNLGPIGFTNN